MDKKKTVTGICLVLTAIIILSVVISEKFRASNPTVSDPEISSEGIVTTTVKNFDYSELSSLLSAKCKKIISANALKKLDNETLDRLYEAAQSDGEIDWHAVTGYTLNALLDNGKSRDMGNNGKDSFELGFTGDINFTENEYVMPHAYNFENVVLDCIDDKFLEEMKNVDIMMVNNEFPYSDRGSPTPNKKYTFRAKPENVKYMQEMGVDLVSLANNHAYDYGYESFIDTMDTLNKADIPFVGAGMNYEEAAKPYTFIINGYKVAYFASCGVEWPVYTPVATEDTPGIMGTYDDGAALIEEIKKANEDCDYIIVYPHWGWENTTELTDSQLKNSKKYIDAGADAVIGDHPHILQGIEFYNGKPVIYSLGNFWFNTRYQYTGMLKLKITGDEIETYFIPGRQANSETHYLSDPAEQRTLYDLLISWSPRHAIEIDDNGKITEKEN